MRENAALVRQGYEAFSNGDLETIRGNATEDIVWRVPGNNAISGDKVGIEATLAYFVQLFELTGGTVKVDLIDVAVGEMVVIGYQRNTADFNGKKMDAQAALVFEFRDGKICRCTEHEEDQAAVDAFFA